MRSYAWIFLAAAAGAGLAAGAEVWKDKRIAEWSAEEARQVLTDSPWAKTATPRRSGSGGAGKQPVSVGRGGIGVGSVGVGLPGMGGPSARGSVRHGPDDARRSVEELPTLTVRWASAMPVISAELIARETSAPSVDEAHYALVVYGVPDQMVHGNPKTVAADLKMRAAIRREGKRDLRPSSVEVIMHDDGPVLLYLFPRSTEITRNDKRLDFEVEIGQIKLTQAFIPDEMVYQGKLEL